jgi:hypothetical protein
MVPPMRRTMTLALLVLSLLLPLGSAGLLDSASARPVPVGERSHHPGLLITYRGWGKLHRGMNVKQAQRTGMVSHQLGHCAPGYLLTKPYQTRGYIYWGMGPKPWKVRQIIVTGRRDHTAHGSHPGTRLGQLRRQHPNLSKVVSAGSLRGVHQKRDLWLAWMQEPYGTITFQFPYGLKPTRTTRLDTIIVANKPAYYYGC